MFFHLISIHFYIIFTQVVARPIHKLFLCYLEIAGRTYTTGSTKFCIHSCHHPQLPMNQQETGGRSPYTVHSPDIGA